MLAHCRVKELIEVLVRPSRRDFLYLCVHHLIERLWLLDSLPEGRPVGAGGGNQVVFLLERHTPFVEAPLAARGAFERTAEHANCSPLWLRAVKLVGVCCLFRRRDLDLQLETLRTYPVQLWEAGLVDR